MSLFSILLASLFVPRREGERSGDLEDPKMARPEVKPSVGDEYGNERRGRDLGPDDDIADDGGSIQDQLKTQTNKMPRRANVTNRCLLRVR